jgi:hypothetical protein
MAGPIGTHIQFPTLAEYRCITYSIVLPISLIGKEIDWLMPIAFQLSNNSTTRITSQIDNQDYSPEIPETRKKYEPKITKHIGPFT